MPLSLSAGVAWTANFCNLPVNSLSCVDEFVQAVNADLNPFGRVDSKTVDAFGVTHDRLRPLRCQLKQPRRREVAQRRA